jgi:hypothetical protein
MKRGVTTSWTPRIRADSKLVVKNDAGDISLLQK